MSDIYLEDLPLWGDEEAKTMLENICAKHQIPMEVISELVGMQRERQYQERAHGVYERIAEILDRIS